MAFAFLGLGILLWLLILVGGGLLIFFFGGVILTILVLIFKTIWLVVEIIFGFLGKHSKNALNKVDRKLKGNKGRFK